MERLPVGVLTTQIKYVHPFDPVEIEREDYTGGKVKFLSKNRGVAHPDQNKKEM